MILAIEGVDRHLHPDLFEQMFRMRAAVFADRLGWDVTVVDGREVDQFDAEDPLYLLCVDEVAEELKGAVRLLPTTGPNMLRDVFSVLVPDGSVESPLIWESSRFAVNPKLTVGPTGHEANHTVNSTMVELLCGLVEAARLAGVEHIVSVFDARMARIFRTVDCPYEVIGHPTRIGRTMTYAGLFEISDSMRRRLGNKAGLHEPVLSRHRFRCKTALQA
ncbi:acyl-homoserine-lactone synthase [Mesorhizobium sp. L-8-10]|uniref:acyl-homoserine-lactone synthase n=1 Tax=Mesorhizobium sp. L-8-10 TaxID=2744523 RepID=UPI001926AF1D|nr:acyl-homoserine-lactone synthase [Mesorhizobium sp. L-8-10]BCH29802.1 acyl-homoserine-lactone synthase [Mesorhizobium sp. L-8-10]